MLISCGNVEAEPGPTLMEKISPTEILITKGALSKELAIIAMITNQIVEV